jgi:hypothetical protein
MIKVGLSLLSIFPFAGFYMTIVAQSNVSVPTDMVNQGWLLTALAAAVALTRIALWLRGDKPNGNGKAKIENLDKILSGIDSAVEGVVKNQENILKIGNRAMESHVKIAATNEALLRAIEAQTAELRELTREIRDSKHEH